MSPPSASCPGALQETTETLGKVERFADAARARPPSGCGPAARALAPANDAVRPLAREATPLLRDDIRPFVREARPARARPAAGRRAPRPGDAGPHALFERAQPPPQPARLQPGRPRGPGQGRRARRATCSGSPGSPHMAMSSSRTPTPTAPSARTRRRAVRDARAARQASSPRPSSCWQADADPRPSSAACGDRLMHKSAPSPGRDRRDGALRAVVLRAAAVPVAVVRRHRSRSSRRATACRSRSPRPRTLGLEADVRIAGVSVGKVRKKELDAGGNRTLATIEIDERYAPLRATRARSCARRRCSARRTSSSRPGTRRAEAARGRAAAPTRRCAGAVELDEIFDALDPETRKAFRTGSRSSAGHRGPRARPQRRARHAARLRREGDRGARRARHAGAARCAARQEHRRVFGALTESEDQLRDADHVVRAASSTRRRSQNDALAEAIRIFPTFLDESKATSRA